MKVDSAQIHLRRGPVKERRDAMESVVGEIAEFCDNPGSGPAEMAKGQRQKFYLHASSQAGPIQKFSVSRVGHLEGKKVSAKVV